MDDAYLNAQRELVEVASLRAWHLRELVEVARLTASHLRELVADLDSATSPETARALRELAETDRAIERLRRT